MKILQTIAVIFETSSEAANALPSSMTNAFVDGAACSLAAPTH